MRRFLLQALTAMAMSLPVVGTLAHAFLNQAVPPVDGTVTTSLKEIRLSFSEGIEPRFSGIDLATSDGRAIASGPATPDPSDDKQLVLVLPPLAPGRYKISWHVVSVDTHRTEGAYSFTVAP
jgi:methionine-rich copper-binding protein CopC